jgi:hypothetical protein
MARRVPSRAVAQSAWTRRELAGMLIEVALDHDPDNPTTAEVAELLLRRALAFDPKSDAGYLAIVPTARTSLGSLGIPFVTGSLEQRS